MPEDPSLGQLIRELISTLGEYLKQNLADTVDRALSQPLKRAARKVAFLGLALGLATMAGIFLALAFFNVLVELFGAKSAAYAITCVLCLVVAALCAWVVSRDGKKRSRRKAGGDDSGSCGTVDADPGEADG